MALFKPKNPDPKTGVDYEKLGRSMESVLVKDYIYLLGSTRRQVLNAFLRGIATGFGGVIGATLVVAIVGYVLTALVNADISPFSDVARNIESIISPTK